MVAFTIYRPDMYFPAHLLNDTNSQTAPFRPLLPSARRSNFGPALFSAFRVATVPRALASFHHLAMRCQHCLASLCASSLLLASVWVHYLLLHRSPLLPESSPRLEGPATTEE